eukprot:11683010-Ditylum_brightwellii.AAC.1
MLKKSVKIHLKKEKLTSDLLISKEELDADKSIPTNAKPRHNINQNNEKLTSDLFISQEELAASKIISKKEKALNATGSTSFFSLHDDNTLSRCM